MIDPEKLKRIILLAIKILIALEIIGAITDGASGKGWERLGGDLLVALILFLTWGRIKHLIEMKRQQTRKAVEGSGENVKLWDALAFSLLWSDEIYGEIPRDRKRLIVISYTLITLGVIAAFLEIGPGLMPLIVAGSLVLAAVNLLAWVVGAERGEKESLETELSLAHDVQISLMPTEDPVVEGLDIAGRSIPAKVVGGDHFTYTRNPDEEDLLSVSVFDVSGKGMQAAMSAVFVSGAFANESKRVKSPAPVLTELNKAVYNNSQRGHFIAFLLASFDLQKGVLRFTNAGQSKPLLVSDKDARWLNGTGPTFPLGMVEDTKYRDQKVKLKAGDTLLFMTDGFTEAMNSEKEMFGPERMVDLVVSLDPATLSAADIIEGITESVRKHMKSAEQHDDMTMVVVKYLDGK